MKVLILAAGYGIRLYPITKDISKVLLPVKGKPVIEYIVEKLEYINVNGIYVVTNDRFFSHLEEWVNGVKRSNSKISNFIEVINDCTISENDKLGAIGDVDYVIKNKKIQEDLLIIAGDNLFEFGLNEFISFSQRNSKYPTIGITSLDSKKLASQYGIVKIDENNHVKEFEEKPINPKSNLVAIGIYYFSLESLYLISEYLEEKNNPDAMGYLITWFCKNYEVYSYSFLGQWYDIGSLERYRQVGGDLVEEKTQSS